MNFIFKGNKIWNLLLIVMLLVPNIYLVFQGSDFEGATMVKKFIFLMLSIVLLCSPLIFLRPKLFFLLGILYIIIVPFELVNIYLYHSLINSGIILAVYHTSFYEATELLKWLLPFVVFSLFFIAIYVYLAIKKISFKDTFTLKFRIIIASIVLVTLVGLWIRDLRISSNMHVEQPFKKNFQDGTNNFSNKFSKIFPFGTFIQSYRAVGVHNDWKNYKKKLSTFRFNAFKKDTIKINEKYVLIIGESSRSANYQLYGYQRNTNPELCKLDNLEVFSDFTATANLTSICFPLILTRATPDSFDISYKEKTVVSAFKEAGFRTYWISNQGVYNTELARFASDIDKVYNLNSNIDFNGNFDENIFPLLDSVLQHKDAKQLIIINLMGSHFRYNFRYPPKYDRFKPGFEGAFDYMAISPANSEKLMNIYDNSILYTDFIIASIVKKIDLTNSLSMLMYLSDHGENLYDNNSGVFGHGNNDPTSFEIQIPFLVWHSEYYRNIYPEKVKALKHNKQKKACANNIFHSLIDGANISVKNERETKSLFSNRFKVDSVRKVLVPNMEVVTYDK